MGLIIALAFRCDGKKNKKVKKETTKKKKKFQKHNQGFKER